MPSPLIHLPKLIRDQTVMTGPVRPRSESDRRRAAALARTRRADEPHATFPRVA